ncbi:MAG: glycosyltransferase family 2 protein [Lentisphaeria bacterium]|nr:glycosyltransferase family 2 protein [Lentisphaerota bacterium]MBR7145718.1 glycosyltransferase family 2 protein [Lentisphaeria bacterium]
MSANLTIVIPCYNEEENIPVFFPELLKFVQQHGFKVIAVNDGSKDNTLQELEKFTADGYIKVISHKCNKGYGGAIKTGLRAVTTEYAITIDSDGQHRLEDVIKCYEYIKQTNADMVVGSRQNNESGGYRTLGKWVIRTFAASLLELPVKDLNSGMKCYRMSESLDYLDLCPDTMAYSDCILLLMVNDRKLVTETPIEIAPRTAGKSTIGTRTAIITLAEILNLAVLLRPLTTFFRLSLCFFIMGVIWGVFTYLRSWTVTSTSVMLIVMSVLSFMLGLLCEQLSQIRRKLAKSSNAKVE